MEIANNSAGIYSMLQKMPNAEPSVERRLFFKMAESDITLTCPGYLRSIFIKK